MGDSVIALHVGGGEHGKARTGEQLGQLRGSPMHYVERQILHVLRFFPCIPSHGDPRSPLLSIVHRTSVFVRLCPCLRVACLHCRRGDATERPSGRPRGSA